jgi:hypothetical protein
MNCAPVGAAPARFVTVTTETAPATIDREIFQRAPLGGNPKGAVYATSRTRLPRLEKRRSMGEHRTNCGDVSQIRTVSGSRSILRRRFTIFSSRDRRFRSSKSGSTAPRSQRDMVLTETPSISASFCWLTSSRSLKPITSSTVLRSIPTPERCLHANAGILKVLPKGRVQVDTQPVNLCERTEIILSATAQYARLRSNTNQERYNRRIRFALERDGARRANIAEYYGFGDASSSARRC